MGKKLWYGYQLSLPWFSCKYKYVTLGARIKWIEHKLKQQRIAVVGSELQAFMNLAFSGALSRPYLAKNTIKIQTFPSLLCQRVFYGFPYKTILNNTSFWNELKKVGNCKRFGKSLKNKDDYNT